MCSPPIECNNKKKFIVQQGEIAYGHELKKTLMIGGKGL